MSLPELKQCPGTLKEGYSTYSRTCLNRVFNGRRVHHILPYDSPATNEETDDQFNENRKSISISGVQEKFSVLLEKNKLRLIREGERGTYILKPIPGIGKNAAEMPANEHLTMQIARQLFKIETAENAMIFFKNGSPAYITKRFDVIEDGSKWAQEDFASIAGRTPQTHGEHYKYQGNYLFSNGDAHYKNFSLIETPMGDFRLSPAYDLLNSRIHIEDKDFALEEGLLPGNLAGGNVLKQFQTLAYHAGLSEKQVHDIFMTLTSETAGVFSLVKASFLSEKIQRNYWQAYQARLKKLTEC